MTRISVRFTIVTPGSLDPGMHFGLEVKCLRLSIAEKSNKENEMWRIGRLPDRLASHACVPGSNSADPAWGFQRAITLITASSS